MTKFYIKKQGVKQLVDHFVDKLIITMKSLDTNDEAFFYHFSFEPFLVKAAIFKNDELSKPKFKLTNLNGQFTEI